MKKTRILIIDDEPGFTRLVKLNLEESGPYEVHTENSSLQGFRAAKEFNPDLIFLDIIMPEKDGGDVAHQIRGHPELKNIPIIFLSAVVSRKEAYGTTFMSGGEIFLAKPTTIEALQKCIQENVKAAPASPAS